jgi:hypothetical protein
MRIYAQETRLRQKTTEKPVQELHTNLVAVCFAFSWTSDTIRDCRIQ